MRAGGTTEGRQTLLKETEGAAAWEQGPPQEPQEPE